MSGGGLVLGTRGSALALRQAGLVRDELKRLGHSVEIKEIKTTGDRILDVPLSDIGDKALFTKELDLALLDGSIHLAVHSLKDLPTRLPAGLILGAVTDRKDPRDAFIARAAFGKGLDSLPEGAVVATASLRRKAHLKAWRRDLRIEPVRGNVDTRIRKLDESNWAGILLACAGLERLGMTERITERISTDIMLPAVGQGALAVVCAEEDVATMALLRETLHHAPSYISVIAERAFLRTLEGGCSVPVAAYGRIESGRLVLEGSVADLDGLRQFRGRREGDPEDAESMGVSLAEELLARGADEVLSALRERDA